MTPECCQATSLVHAGDIEAVTSDNQLDIVILMQWHNDDFSQALDPIDFLENVTSAWDDPPKAFTTSRHNKKLMILGKLLWAWDHKKGGLTVTFCASWIGYGKQPWLTCIFFKVQYEGYSMKEAGSLHKTEVRMLITENYNFILLTRGL